MVEKANDLVQRVLKKSGPPHTFYLRLAPSVLELNRREIPHLGYSPFEIHHGFQPAGSLEKAFPDEHRTTLQLAV